MKNFDMTVLVTRHVRIRVMGIRALNQFEAETRAEDLALQGEGYVMSEADVNAEVVQVDEGYDPQAEEVA